MMDRRQLLVSAAAALGVAATGLPGREVWARVRNGEAGSLSDQQMKALTAACDLMIPRTGTPGAVDAGVPAFVALMIADWAADWRKKALIASIDQLVALGVLDSGEKSTSQLAAFDADVFGKKIKGDKARHYRELKSLIVWSYYTSEEGGSEEMLYDPVPGPYRNAKVSEVGGSWLSQ